MITLAGVTRPADGPGGSFSLVHDFLRHAFGVGQLGKRKSVHVHLHTGRDELDDADIRSATVVPLTSIVAIRVGSSELFPADRYRRVAAARSPAALQLGGGAL
jgi:hypothetical protein